MNEHNSSDAEALPQEAVAASPFNLANIRLFILFRCLFNARFYYPVFTILFLDYGLSIEQFSILNTVWAITIVCAEVPSGALADVLGRRLLLISTAALMVLEMLILAFVPLGNGNLIFIAFLFNRILSGLAEAMGSGADEAIAYDTLVSKGLRNQWPRVLTMVHRMRALAAVFSLASGSILYSPQAINGFFSFFGVDLALSQQTTMRFPIYATLLFAIGAFCCALRMQEVTIGDRPQNRGIMAALFKTLESGQWILKTPFALVIILFGMGYDHVLRMVATFTSQYYRCIDLPDAIFGTIGALMSLLGLITPKIAEILCDRYTPKSNMITLTVLTLFSLSGLVQFYPMWGILFVALTYITMTFVSFMVSNYLNIITSSANRATVLSFKGMAFNLAYGFIGFIFALLLTRLRGGLAAEHPLWTHQQFEAEAFKDGMVWFPWYTLAVMALLIFFSMRLLRDSTDHLTIPAATAVAEKKPPARLKE